MCQSVGFFKLIWTNLNLLSFNVHHHCRWCYVLFYNDPKATGTRLFHIELILSSRVLSTTVSLTWYTFYMQRRGMHFTALKRHVIQDTRTKKNLKPIIETWENVFGVCNGIPFCYIFFSVLFMVAFSSKKNWVKENMDNRHAV